LAGAPVCAAQGIIRSISRQASRKGELGAFRHAKQGSGAQTERRCRQGHLTDVQSSAAGLDLRHLRLVETSECRAKLVLGHPRAPSRIRDPATYLIESYVSGHSN
jgi:hypothetical protein